MIKTVNAILLCSIFSTILYCSGSYNGSTTACVTIAGAIVKAQHAEIDKKYKRSECPVCKGKGWYISGDDITKVPCGYCEPDKKESVPPKTLIRKR